MILSNEITAWDYFRKDGLKSMRDIVYENDRYIDFIKQPLHPSQFIAWDMEKNCPLEKPEDYDMKGKGFLTTRQQNELVDNYQQAEERVLFEGFEFGDTNEFNTRVVKGFLEICIPSDKYKSISDLKDKVHIKDKVAKQLKLM